MILKRYVKDVTYSGVLGHVGGRFITIIPFELILRVVGLNYRLGVLTRVCKPDKDVSISFALEKVLDPVMNGVDFLAAGWTIF